MALMQKFNAWLDKPRGGKAKASAAVVAMTEKEKAMNDAKPSPEAAPHLPTPYASDFHSAQAQAQQAPVVPIGTLTPAEAIATGKDVVINKNGSATVVDPAPQFTTAIPATASTVPVVTPDDNSPSPVWTATHTAQWNGQWWTPEAASKAADLAQRAKEREESPVAPAVVQEPESAPVAYTSESNVGNKSAPVIQPVATATLTSVKESTIVATTPIVTTTPTTTTVPVITAVKPNVGQDIGNFFKGLLADVEKGFAFADKIEVAAQPIVQEAEMIIAPINPALATAIAAGDGLVNGVFSVTGSVLNTIQTVGATNATPEQKMAAALPAIEQEILSDPTLAGAVKAVGGTPTNIAQFNASLTAAAQALYLLTTAI